MPRAMQRVLHPNLMAATFPAALATACTPSKDASSRPEERATCEIRCIAKRGTCRASDYDCDRAKTACMQGCRYWE